MKICEAISRVDECRPNGYGEGQKIAWLSKLDGMVVQFILRTHGVEPDFRGYDLDTEREIELLAPAPFDEMYLRWLEAQIDLANMEFDAYNVSITLFNAEYQAFENDYNRNHRHSQTGKRFRF